MDNKKAYRRQHQERIVAGAKGLTPLGVPDS